MKQKKRKPPPGAPFAAARGGFDGETGSETDGLSRNPEDCASYGCVDNGGG